MKKEEYQEQLKEIKENVKKDIKEIKKKYENSIHKWDDHINSLYVRKIYYKVTLKNIKRDGWFNFFWWKFLAERKYFYCKLKGRRANLKSNWQMPDVIYEERFDHKFDQKNVLAQLQKIVQENGGEMVEISKSDVDQVLFMKNI